MTVFNLRQPIADCDPTYAEWKKGTWVRWTEICQILNKRHVGTVEFVVAVKKILSFTNKMIAKDLIELPYLCFRWSG